MEQPITTVWPTIGALALGRWVGSLAGATPPGDRFRVFGRAMAFATIPVSLAVYAWQLMPFVTRCYRLTNKRVVVLRGLGRREESSVAFADFDAIDIEVLAGQDWLKAGDLVFRRQGQEVFRLAGVSRPEVFRTACLRAQAARLTVQQVLARQTVTA